MTAIDLQSTLRDLYLAAMKIVSGRWFFAIATFALLVARVGAIGADNSITQITTLNGLVGVSDANGASMIQLPEGMTTAVGLNGPPQLPQDIDMSPYFVQENASLIGNLSQDDGSTKIAVLSGTITLRLPDGTTLQVTTGEGAIVNRNGQATRQTLAEMIATEKLANGGKSRLADYLVQAVQTVANTAAKFDSNGHMSPEMSAVAKVAALVKLATAADPSLAQAVVSAAVSSLTNPNASINDDKTAVSVIVQAAIQGNPSAKETAVAAAATAAASSGVSFSAADLNSNTSLQNTILTQQVLLDVTVRSGSGGSG
jgi:hypothetical protein